MRNVRECVGHKQFPMKIFTILAFLSLAFYSTGFAQEQVLGLSKEDAIAQLPHKTSNTLEGKQYPLIKETIKLEGNGTGPSTTYLFIDSADKVCRMHLIYNNLPDDERQKTVNELAVKARAQMDKTDKKHTTYIGRTSVADYIYTWAKDKNRKATYLLVTANDYKQRMLNYLVNGGMLPEDGIFTPSPSAVTSK